MGRPNDRSSYCAASPDPVPHSGRWPLPPCPNQQSTVGAPFLGDRRGRHRQPPTRRTSPSSSSVPDCRRPSSAALITFLVEHRTSAPHCLAAPASTLLPRPQPLASPIVRAAPALPVLSIYAGDDGGHNADGRRGGLPPPPPSTTAAAGAGRNRG